MSRTNLSRSTPIRLLMMTSAVALSLSACTKSEDDPRTGPQLVRVATAMGGGERSRAFTGVVSARIQSDLGFRVPGKVVARLVDTGQAVTRGQPLMRIDRTDLALAAAAQSRFVEAARARALQTAADERRLRDLVSAGAISASAYDQAKAAADAAQAQLKATEAQADVARNEAGYSVLLADADGIVVETLAEPGQVVAAGQTVVKLARAGAREAVVDLPETVRPPIGSVARATAFVGGGTSRARLRQLSSAADPLTRTYEARYVLEGAAARAPLGSTITVELAERKAAGSMEVPLAAIHDNGKGPGVWVVAGAPLQARWRPVRLVGVAEETATIAAGLRPGERFVALGAHLLHEGEAVRLSVEQAQ